MGEKRLGDVIDDFCVKCRRLTNHSIVSLFQDEAAKVRCRTCYHDHDYRHEQAPPTKKELKKAEDDARAALALQNGEVDGVPAPDRNNLDDELAQGNVPHIETEEEPEEAPKSKSGRA
jgi:hypothetical protein